MNKAIYAVFGMFVLCLAGFAVAEAQTSEISGSAEVGEVISIALNSSSIGWTGLVPTDTNVLASTGGAPLQVSIYQETNVATDIRVNGSNLISGGDVLGVSNMSFSNSTTGLVALTSDFSSGGFENFIDIPNPSSTVTRNINWFVSIPVDTAQGTYLGALYVRVLKHV